MIDVSFINENKDAFKKSMNARGCEVDVEAIINLEERRKMAVAKYQSLQAQKNEVVDKISSIKKANPNADTMDLENKTSLITQDIRLFEKEAEGLGGELYEILIRLPNIIDERVPFGRNEEDNVQVQVFGERPTMSFLPKEHHILAAELNMMDVELGTKLSGSRFSILSSDLSRLYRALVSFMIDINTESGLFREVYFPYLVKKDVMIGTGQLPKFDDNFKTREGLYLIPTGEVPMVNIVMGEILHRESLPIRLVGYSECFRREAGSASKDIKGIFRQHQFGKVELISVCAQEDSEEEHKIILSHAEKVLQGLGLHYRVVLLCSGDIGFASALTYDVEVWLPGQNKYREISSCSNTRDFQSRRMKTKYRDGKQKKYPHTLNGSGVAIGRALIAVLENYQNEDGSIRIPDALQKYMGNQKVIKKTNTIF